MNVKKIFMFLFIFSFVLIQDASYATIANVRTEMDSSGNILAAWQDDFNIGGYQMRASVYLAGSGVWSTPVTISSNVTYNLSDARIALNNSGEAIVIWSGYDIVSGNWTVYGAALTSSLTTWAPAITISGRNDNEQVNDNYFVKLDDGGDFVITWTAYSYNLLKYTIRAVNDTIYNWPSIAAPLTISSS